MSYAAIYATLNILVSSTNTHIYIYIYIYMYIRHPAARHARACSSHCLDFLYSDVLFSPVSTDPPPLSARRYSGLLAASFFNTPFFTTIGTKRSPNGNLKTAQNHNNLKNISIKAHPRTRPTKRLRLEGSKPLKLITVTHFLLLFQRPRAPKKMLKMGAQMESRGAETHRNQEEKKNRNK